ncbi:unnamed protein product (mitochondrion) [Plasmodiophora brassicae]|uniref:Major facilitator superfamily (MFS) profile domain-containing protein n=1 Tax=Plasmodiophora brassicae TaxID=37360 RepID=A0A3P3YGH9_PLABS|nr:unnamed protein product [Plasmodiophora brassicae]
MSAAEMASLSPDVRRRHSHTVEGDDIDDADLLHLLSDDELHLGGALSPVATRQASGIPLTQRQLFALAAYWFGWAVLWMPLLVIVLPKQIVEIAGPESKGSNMSSILMLGSIVSLVCLPLFGSLSDMSTHTFGRRRPFMVAGCVTATISLVVMGYDPPMPVYTSCFLVLSVSNNMIIAPYSALVPDVVPQSQRGTASSWLGAMAMLGYLFGGFLTFFMTSMGTFGTLLLLNVFHALALYVTVKYTDEVQFKPPVSSATIITPRRTPFGSIAATVVSFIAPLRRHDFRLLFITRFMTQMVGIATVQEFLSFFVSDAVVRPFLFRGSVVATSPSEAVAIMFIPMLLGALLTSSLSGVVSNALGGKRKVIVYWSGGLMATGCLFLMVSREFTAVLFAAGVFGCGYGAFTAVDWALATDLLEDDKEYAKDMAVWGIAMVLPNLAMPLVGGLLDYVQRLSPVNTLGYSLVWFIAAVEFTAGSYLVKFIYKIQ